VFCDKTHSRRHYSLLGYQDIQADNSISGTAKDINIQNVNNTDTHYSKHKKVKVSLADVLGTIAKNPLQSGPIPTKPPRDNPDVL
jgi:hypothetical protein